MARQKLEAFGVNTGDEIYVRGTVEFAKIDKLVEGPALEKERARLKDMNMFGAERPFRSISLSNPVTIQGQNSPLDQYFAQHIFQSGEGKQMLNVKTESQFPPTFGHVVNNVVQVIADPEKNPNKGQEVIVQLRAFASKDPAHNMGSALQGIVYPEGPISFYEAGGSLDGFGQALNMSVNNSPIESATPTSSDNQGSNVQSGNQAQDNTGQQGQGFAQPNQNQGNQNQQNQAQNTGFEGFENQGNQNNQNNQNQGPVGDPFNPQR